MPIYNPPPSGLAIATGSYTGDDSNNRGIPHGLGTTPSLIVILNDTGAGSPRDALLTGGVFVRDDDTLAIDTPTAPDSTNFYTGTNATLALNTSGRTYKWWAIG